MDDNNLRSTKWSLRSCFRVHKIIHICYNKGHFDGGMNTIAYMIRFKSALGNVNVNYYTAKKKKPSANNEIDREGFTNDALTMLFGIVSDYSSQVVLPNPSQGRHRWVRGSRHNGRRVQLCTEQESWLHSCILDSIRPRHSNSTSWAFVPYVTYHQECPTRIHKLHPQDCLLSFSHDLKRTSKKKKTNQNGRRN